MRRNKKEILLCPADAKFNEKKQERTLVVPLQTQMRRNKKEILLCPADANEPYHVFVSFAFTTRLATWGELV